MDQETNIIIADDHTLFREGLIRILKKMPGLNHIAEASNGKEVLDLMKKRKWQLIILDLEMPVMNGLQLLEKLEVQPHVPPILVVSMHAHSYIPNKAFKLGAKGYILKGSDSAELKIAIKTLLSGKSYFTPSMRSMFLDNVFEQKKHPKLTSHEIQVLQLICQEKTGKEIAEILHKGERTIEGYRRSLLAKVGCNNSIGLSLFAVEHGYHVLNNSRNVDL